MWVLELVLEAFCKQVCVLSCNKREIGMFQTNNFLCLSKAFHWENKQVWSNKKVGCMFGTVGNLGILYCIDHMEVWEDSIWE